MHEVEREPALSKRILPFFFHARRTHAGCSSLVDGNTVLACSDCVHSKRGSVVRVTWCSLCTPLCPLKCTSGHQRLNLQRHLSFGVWVAPVLPIAVS